MTKVKTFSDYEQQLYILTSEKQIIIQDTDFAKDILERIGYFPLIGGYKHLFRIPFTKTYKSGTTFEEIVALYEFDANLRELFFKYLLQIERHLRSLMSYSFSEKYGESQTAYLDVNNFNFCKKNRKTIIRLIATLQRTTTTTDYAYINHYRDTYGNIPLWVLVNVLTFGNLSKMYQVFPQTLQSKICKSVKTVNPKQMGQFLSCLTKFRNVCAHGERLFTYKTVDAIADLPIRRKMHIPMDAEQYIYGKKDLFAAVIAFRYLLPKKDFCRFKRSLSKLIASLTKSVIHISEAELLKQMGFPPNWKEITRYRIP
ncbi:MAG: Abi family protein [Lachnospiraceae bacterium]|nr:Abi family protein [Lachnospiraceae bacterium]